jgi:hypothetical protein
MSLYWCLVFVITSAMNSLYGPLIILLIVSFSLVFNFSILDWFLSNYLCQFRMFLFFLDLEKKAHY